MGDTTYLIMYRVHERIPLPVFHKLQVVLFLLKTLVKDSHTHGSGVKAFECLLWYPVQRGRLCLCYGGVVRRMSD